jgi:hypothetical protein
VSADASHSSPSASAAPAPGASAIAAAAAIPAHHPGVDFSLKNWLIKIDKDRQVLHFSPILTENWFTSRALLASLTTEDCKRMNLPEVISRFLLNAVKEFQQK